MSKAAAKSIQADFSVQGPEGDSSAAVLTLTGHWVIMRLEGIANRLQAAIKRYDKVRVDSQKLETLDTAGAFVLRQVLGDKLDGDVFPQNESWNRLYGLVDTCKGDLDTYQKDNPEKRRFWLHPIYFMLVYLGQLMTRFWRGFINQSTFMGHVITLWMVSIVRPSRIRWAALFNLMQRAGLEALPIVFVTNMFVGATLAFLLVLTLKQFGAAVFAVDMVAIGVLREFGPLIAAVLVSGRSASAFAAEIGSMKMNQEIDAMRVLGIDPYEALVLPRVVALVLMMPLVTFVGMAAGMFGGALAIWGSLGNGPAFFVQRLHDYVPVVNLFVGMVKTPFLAITIAVVGCRMGMTVKDDVISLGRQVTTAVVQSIFLVFMIDAVFAMLFNGFVF
ncbi:ABC transporter permease [Asticcacaulis sp. 201]|uniref:MlaE family ABC transporter permease n=1 Tax=Asticcacaulis sp. 201 TaxID=3028787 RepID=UPI002917079B|nr:ABC transporter permease [Asticcacaulis sp. 201]MDV6329735.1 ABC transporter permease [Asticcacaulis sp. 201]